MTMPQAMLAGLTAMNKEIDCLRSRNARLVAALSWMGDHEPELVEAAREKFGITNQQSTEKP